MDTKTLVVGQDVFLVYGPYIDRAKVVKVTPSGAEVQTGVIGPDGKWEARDLLQFDKDGKELDVSRRARLGFGPSPDDWFQNSIWNAPECQPWELDDMPFEERLAKLDLPTGHYLGKER